MMVLPREYFVNSERTETNWKGCDFFRKALILGKINVIIDSVIIYSDFPWFLTFDFCKKKT